MRTTAVDERPDTAEENTRTSPAAPYTVIESLFELEDATAADFEELGFPFTALDELTEEEASAFEAIRRQGPPQWVKDL
jgi:hypothetical protein